MKSLPALLWATLACGLSSCVTHVGATIVSPELTNIALNPNALATQSSTCYDGVASRAIDNNTDPNWSGGSMSHTCDFPDKFSWWMVQLDNVTDAYQEIHQIKIYNRQDAYLGSLSKVYVEVLDDKQLPIYSQKLPANSKDTSWTIDFEQPLIGKYVRLRRYIYAVLIIPEVQVIGRPATIPPPSGLAKNIAVSPNAFAFQSSTCYGGKASHAIDGNSFGHWGSNAGSMVHTCRPETDDKFSWWMVDLDALTSLDQVIKEITMYNRVDGYLRSLSYSYVEVLDSYMNTVFSEKLPPSSKNPSYNFEFNEPVIGRFVRVRMYNTFAPLVMAEVSVIGFPITDMTEQPTSEPTLSPSVFPSAAPITPTSQPSVAPSSSPTEPVSSNIALLGKATQSSTCWDGEASRGIDGNTDPSNSTHTCLDDPDPSWWMVDLDETEQVINQVTIFNRNGYTGRLRYAQVQVYDSEMKMSAFKDFPGSFNGPQYTWDFDPPVIGRYLKVQLQSVGYLHFAEIEIWGHPFTGTTVTPPTIPSAMCPPPFDRPEGFQPDAQLVLAGAMQTLQEHMAAGPANPPLLNQTEIMAATDEFLATSHQLTATYDLLETALSLVDAYEGIGGYGLPVSYGPPVIDGRQFSRTRGALDGRELDRSMMLIQQDILDQMYHASLWGEDGSPKPTSSKPSDWSYKPVIKECQELFRGRKWWAAKYTPGLVDPPADPTVVHTELVKVDYPPKWGRPMTFSNLKRAAYPIGGLYLAPGGVAQVTVEQAIVDHGGYHIQVGSQMVGCSRNEFSRQERMTTSFPVDDVTTSIANPFGGELYIRAPYGSIIPPSEVSVTGDVVQGATFFYSSLRNTTEEEWNNLRATAPAPWVHIVTDPLLRQWHAPPVKEMTYSSMVERAQRYTVAYNAAGISHGIPPEKRNTWVLFDIHSTGGCGRASVGSVGYPQSNNGNTISVDGPIPSRYEFAVQDPIIGWGNCCGASPIPHAHDPEGSEVNYDMITWHELGHQASHRYSFYNGGEKESLVHMSYFTARFALEGEKDKSSVDPTGIDTAFMFSCCKQQNPATWAPRYTIDRQALEWMTRDNFRNGLEMTSEETKYQHRGHAKYADIARLTGGTDYFNQFMIEEHERWEAEGLGEGLGHGKDYWNKVSDTTWFPELADGPGNREARTLRFSIKAGQDLSPLLQFWGVHANYTLF